MFGKTSGEFDAAAAGLRAAASWFRAISTEQKRILTTVHTRQTAMRAAWQSPEARTFHHDFDAYLGVATPGATEGEHVAVALERLSTEASAVATALRSQEVRRRILSVSAGMLAPVVAIGEEATQLLGLDHAQNEVLERWAQACSAALPALRKSLASLNRPPIPPSTLTPRMGAAPAPASPAGANHFSNKAIADKAMTYPDGTYLGAGEQGECRVFAGNIVNAVLAASGSMKRIGGYGSSKEGDYYGVYKDAGGVPVSPDQAQPGDLIQYISEAEETSDYPNGFIHTQIVVGRDAATGQLKVVESNVPQGSHKVSYRTLDPSAYAKQRGVGFTIWRFGNVA